MKSIILLASLINPTLPECVVNSQDALAFCVGTEDFCERQFRWRLQACLDGDFGPCAGDQFSFYTDYVPVSLCTHQCFSSDDCPKEGWDCVGTIEFEGEAPFYCGPSGL